MVAEDVAMVWTNLALENYPQPSAEDIALAWTGKLQYNMEYDNISEFNEIYPKLLNNTVIQKTDGPTGCAEKCKVRKKRWCIGAGS